MDREYAEQDDRERPHPRGQRRPRTENPTKEHAAPVPTGIPGGNLPRGSNHNREIAH